MLGFLFGKKKTELKLDRTVVAIGDIHGRADLLDAMLRRLGEIDPSGKHELIFLGDYVDRADHSREVLERLADLQKSGRRAVFLKGNHEAAMLDFAADPIKGRKWLGFGGAQTLASFGIRPPVEDDIESLEEAGKALAEKLVSLKPFLVRLELVARRGEFVFAHAGYDPERPDIFQDENVALWGRFQPAKGGARRNGRARYCLVHGHYDAPEAVIEDDRICVDTGAFYSGKLSAVLLRPDGDPEFICVEDK